MCIIANISPDSNKLPRRKQRGIELVPQERRKRRGIQPAEIQDARTPRDRQDKTLSLFKEYQKKVTEIVMLRAFWGDSARAPTRYQLVEIPVSIFDSIQQADLRVFERDALVIDFYISGDPVAHVAIDRSDAKVTVRSIKLSACTVHAEWSHA